MSAREREGGVGCRTSVIVGHSWLSWNDSAVSSFGMGEHVVDALNVGLNGSRVGDPRGVIHYAACDPALLAAVSPQSGRPTSSNGR